MKLKQILFVSLWIYALPVLLSQPLNMIYAESNDTSESSGDKEVKFECSDNLRKDLCEDLEKEFASSGMWKSQNQQALECISKKCSGTVDNPFDECQKVGFGQYCDGVKEVLEQSSDEDTIWSSEIKADTQGKGKTAEEAHKNLVLSALGFHTMVPFMVREAIHNSNGDFDKAKSIYTSNENLSRQIEEAKQQSGYYDNIITRTINTEALCKQPYNGNMKQFIEDEFFMDASYLAAINVSSNGVAQLLDDNNDPKKLFAKGAVGSNGMLASREICQNKDSATNLPSDALLGALSNQTSVLESRKIIDNTGQLTGEGKDLLKVAEKYEENAAVQCAIKEKEVSYLYQATKGNDRFMTSDSFVPYCTALGKSGCGIPTGKLPDACGQSYEKSLDKYLEDYMQSDKFVENDYINPTTGRLKENTKELLREKLSAENKELLSKAMTENDQLNSVIEINSRFNTITELLKTEMGNNNWFFKSGQTIMTADGGRVIDSADIQKIKEMPVKGKDDFNSENFKESGLSASSNTASGSSAAGESSASQVAGNATKRWVSAYQSAPVDELTSDDEDAPNKSFKQSSGFSLFGTPKKKSDSQNLVNPLYSDNISRNNLLDFPKEVRRTGKLSEIRLVKDWCQPSLIRPPGEDPNCYCVRGPLLRNAISLDESFNKPSCPSDSGVDSNF